MTVTRGQMKWTVTITIFCRNNLIKMRAEKSINYLKYQMLACWHNFAYITETVCTMYVVPCTLYIVQCGHCTVIVYTIHYTVYIVPFPAEHVFMWAVQILNSVHCTVCALYAIFVSIWTRKLWRNNGISYSIFSLNLKTNNRLKKLLSLYKRSKRFDILHVYQ